MSYEHRERLGRFITFLEGIQMARYTQEIPTVVRCKQLQFQTTLSKSGIYAKMDPASPGFDPTFPTPIRLGLRAVGWLQHEVSAWITGRIAATRKVA